MHGQPDHTFIEAARQEVARRRANPQHAQHEHATRHSQPTGPPEPPSTDDQAAAHWKASEQHRQQAARDYLTRINR